MGLLFPLIYSSKLNNIQRLRSKIIDEIYPSLLSEYDKLFPGIADAIIHVISKQKNDTFIDLLKIKEVFFRDVTDYIKLIMEHNRIYIEARSKFKNISSLENKHDIDIKLSHLKKQLVKKSTALFSNHIVKKIESKKPIVQQAVKDYFEKWKDNELMTFYSQLKEHFGIWVTTNLSTTYNIPNRPKIFDYLIIDEASQNDIASAIPLLFRAKNAVIIGDPNQLRHITNLKDNKINDIAKRSKLKSDQLTFFHCERYSAFDLAKKRYIASNNCEPIVLSNHYRSYVDIINFSNSIVSDYNLFPKNYIKSEINQIGIPLGIHWNDIEGNYRNNNTNPREAEAIILFLESKREMLENISVGIITPFSNQAKLISEMLNMSDLHSIDKNKNIIASTVHKFQGDERDVILYSPVISSEILTRKVRTLKWANEQTNLLNVAITRARSSLIIFGDMNFCRSNDGLHKVLLDYVNSMSYRNSEPDYSGDYSGTEKLFRETLVENNFEFEYQVPVENGKYILDFVLKADDHFINIELDGRHHQRKRTQDYSRDNQMKELGFEVLRFTNEYVKENLQGIIESLQKVCSTS